MNIGFEEYSSLTFSEKICFGKIESIGLEILQMNLEDLANYSQVSTATINRTLKKMGYKNLKEYKNSLSIDNANDNTSPFEQTLIDLIQSTNVDICEDITKSGKVYVVGFGITSSLANDFVCHLRKLGIRCEAITDSDMLNFIQIVDINNPLIIYVSYSGADLDMQKVAVNNKHKMKQILITCTTNSILSYSCDKVICTNTSAIDEHLNSRIPLYIVIMKQIRLIKKFNTY